MKLEGDNCICEFTFCEKLDDGGFAKYRNMLSSRRGSFLIDSPVFFTKRDLCLFLDFFQKLITRPGFSICVPEDQSFLPLEADFTIIYPAKLNLLECHKTTTHVMLSCLIACWLPSKRYQFGISDWFPIESVNQFISDIAKELQLRYNTCPR